MNNTQQAKSFWIEEINNALKKTEVAETELKIGVNWRESLALDNEIEKIDECAHKILKEIWEICAKKNQGSEWTKKIRASRFPEEEERADQYWNLIYDIISSANSRTETSSNNAFIPPAPLPPPTGFIPPVAPLPSEIATRINKNSAKPQSSFSSQIRQASRNNEENDEEESAEELAERMAKIEAIKQAKAKENEKKQQEAEEKKKREEIQKKTNRLLSGEGTVEDLVGEEEKKLEKLLVRIEKDLTQKNYSDKELSYYLNQVSNYQVSIKEGLEDELKGKEAKIKNLENSGGKSKNLKEEVVNLKKELAKQRTYIKYREKLDNIISQLNQAKASLTEQPKAGENYFRLRSINSRLDDSRKSKESSPSLPPEMLAMIATLNQRRGKISKEENEGKDNSGWEEPEEENKPKKTPKQIIEEKKKLETIQFKSTVSSFAKKINGEIKNCNIFKVKELLHSVSQFQNEHDNLLVNEGCKNEKKTIDKLIENIDAYRKKLVEEAGVPFVELEPKNDQLKNNKKLKKDLMDAQKIIADAQTQLGIDELNNLTTILAGQNLWEIIESANQGADLQKQIKTFLEQNLTDPLPNNWTNELIKSSELRAANDIIKQLETDKVQLANDLGKKFEEQLAIKNAKISLLKTKLSNQLILLNNYQTNEDKLTDELNQQKQILQAEKTTNKNLSANLINKEQQITKLGVIITNSQTQLRVNDLLNLPTLPTGQSLNDLIIFFNKPSQPACSLSAHSDYDKLKQEQQQLEKEINKKLNSRLNLNLKNKLDLDKIIEKIKELLSKPDNNQLSCLQKELEQHKQTINKLEEQLNNKENSSSPRLTIEETKQFNLQIFKEILPELLYQQSVQELEKVTSYQELSSIQQKIISAYGKQVAQQQNEKLQTKQYTKERIVWISILLVSLLIIGKLLLSLKKKETRKIK